MKQFFFTLVAALMSTTMVFAQSTLVATLSHGDEISMFYGAYALQQAHTKAVSGDIINLSGGSFQAPTTITKAITLRGTGIDDANPTYIITDFAINVSTTDTGRLSMEGVRCSKTVTLRGTLNNAYFLKCQFYQIVCYNADNTYVKNAMFANCKITYHCLLRGASTMQLINSYVAGLYNENSQTCAASCVNCVLNYSGSSMSSCQIINSVIFSSSNVSTGFLSESSMATKCVGINLPNSYFSHTPHNTDCSISTFANVFKSFTGTYSGSSSFELSDEAKTKYLGNDGTEIGLYGGVLPYSSTPSYPQITKMNVGNKTTADGKLSVEIEVSAAE